MGECLNSSLLAVQFPAQASEGIRDLRHVQGGAVLYQLSLSRLEMLCGHPGGKSLLPPGQGLQWMMMEWLVVLSRCHRYCGRRRHSSSLLLVLMLW